MMMQVVREADGSWRRLGPQQAPRQTIRTRQLYALPDGKSRRERVNAPSVSYVAAHRPPSTEHSAAWPLLFTPASPYAVDLPIRTIPTLLL